MTKTGGYSATDKTQVNKSNGWSKNSCKLRKMVDLLTSLLIFSHKTAFINLESDIVL